VVWLERDIARASGGDETLGGSPLQLRPEGVVVAGSLLEDPIETLPPVRQALHVGEGALAEGRHQADLVDVPQLGLLLCLQHLLVLLVQLHRQVLLGQAQLMLHLLHLVVL
jgi:hypothetical protein